MLRRIGALNFIEQFKYGALTLALPLYLISRGVNVGDIGLVLSLLPLAFVLIRLVSSVFADVMGVKVFFILSMALQSITSLIYSTAVLPIHFAIGKISEGASEACFWAVDRTAIIARAQEKRYLGVMGSVREFGGAAGILWAGLLVTYFSFELLFWMVLISWVVGVLVASNIRNRGATLKRPDWGTLFRLKRKEANFWDVSLATILLNVSYLLVFTFLLPVVLDEMGMSYLHIAMMLAGFYMCVGVGLLVSVKMDLDENRLLFFQLMAIPFIAMLPLMGDFFLHALLLAGFGYGVCLGLNEAMIGYIAENGKGISSRISVLIAPMNFCTFIAFAVSGFALEALGSEVLFAIAGALVFGYVLVSKKIMDDLGKKTKIMEYHPHAIAKEAQ
jgi:MFS family permease